MALADAGAEPREQVYATKVGSRVPGEAYILGAHMDGRGGGEAANDDGSGTELVMEIARVLADVDTERSLRPSACARTLTGTKRVAARARTGQTTRRRWPGWPERGRDDAAIIAAKRGGVKKAVENRAAESQNAFGEDALLRRLKELRREKIYAAYAEAARDGAFMDDMRSATEAFGVTSGDGLI